MKDVGAGALLPDKDGKNIFLCSSEGMKKIETEGGKVTPIEFEAFFDYRPYGERGIFSTMFGNRWMISSMWKICRERTGRAIRRAINASCHISIITTTLRKCWSEMLGELNASHTGARYYASGATLPTAALGVFYDESYIGDGLKIKEIIAQSPLTKRKTDVKPGCIIEKIDGCGCQGGYGLFPLLSR